MSLALAALCERSNTVRDDSEMEQATVDVAKYIDEIIEKVNPYIDYNNLSGFDPMEKAAIILGTYKKAEQYEFKNPIDEGVWIEVITFLIIRKTMPEEKPVLKSVLFGTSLPGAPFYGLDIGDLPNSYNFVLCYIDEDEQEYFNKGHYAGGKVYLCSGALVLMIDRQERKKKWRYAE